MKLPAHMRLPRGFTLIELMITVLIVSVLLAVAVPSYQNQVRKSRRIEAKTALLDFASREERFLSTAANGANYSQVAGDLGYPALPQVVGSGYYSVNVCVAGAAACAPSNLPTPAFTVTATPVAGTSQALDLPCTSFSVDSAGQQFATGSMTAAQCWQN